MTLYVVKHIGTKQYLPIEKGASWWEGYNLNGTVRIFKNAKAARSFISSWVRGRVMKRYIDGSTPWSDSIETFEYEDVGRTKDMLVAIPVEIKELV